MSDMLIGTSTQGSKNTSAERFILGKFKATHKGNVTEILVCSRAPGNVKVAIYKDNGGEPGDLLNCNSTPTPVTGDTTGKWNSISISSTPVNKGTCYWLAAANDVAG